MDTVGTSVTQLLGTLTMNSGDVNTTNEVAARSFTVSFTLDGLSTVTFTIDGGRGEQVGAIPYVGGQITDSATNESDPWDVRFDFTGLSQDINFGTTGLLRAVILGTGDSPVISFNYNGDSEQVYAQITLIQADAEGVPEPATFVLLGSALLLGLGIWRRKRA